MRIAYVDPGAGLYDRHFQHLFASLGRPGAAVEVRHLEGLPEEMRDAFLPIRPFYYSELLRAVVRAEEEGFDAVIIGCAADPGLREAAQAVRIPVVAPLKAGLHLALLQRRTVAVVSPGHHGRTRRPMTWHLESARLYGFADRVVAWRRAHVPRPADEEITRRLREDPAGLARDITAAFAASASEDALAQALAAVEEDGAEAVFFACTLWGGQLAPVAERLPVPVIDPVIASLALAEAAVQARTLVRGPAAPVRVR